MYQHGKFPCNRVFCCNCSLHIEPCEQTGLASCSLSVHCCIFWCFVQLTASSFWWWPEIVHKICLYMLYLCIYSISTKKITCSLLLVTLITSIHICIHGGKVLPQQNRMLTWLAATFNQSIIELVLRHSTTVLMGQTFIDTHDHHWSLLFLEAPKFTRQVSHR